MKVVSNEQLISFEISLDNKKDQSLSIGDKISYSEDNIVEVNKEIVVTGITNIDLSNNGVTVHGTGSVKVQ